MQEKERMHRRSDSSTKRLGRMEEEQLGVRTGRKQSKDGRMTGGKCAESDGEDE